MGALSLRSATVPRFALRRDEAAAALGISTTLFVQWVADGKMPQGRKVGGVTLWDVTAVQRAWLEIYEPTPAADERETENPFDRLVV